MGGQCALGRDDRKCPERTGTCRYNIEQYTRIVALALKPPSEYARPITHWSARELADEIRLAEHEKQVAEICALYSAAPQLHNAGTHLISTDEKTSIQALERVAPTKPMISGHPEKIEFEYKRHGTLSLIPFFEVATGKIVQHHIGETRNEQDYGKTV